MDYKTCEECYKRIPIQRIIVKATDDGNCYYCRMCIDYIDYIEKKGQELMIKYGITNAMIDKEIKEMDSY